MKILITGAGGYVGMPLVEKLLNDGYDIIALDRYYFGVEKSMDFYKKYSDFTLYRTDIREVKSIESVDTIIDLAGLSNDATAEINPQLTREINYEGAIRLARLAKESGVKKYLYSSSASVYGHGENTGLKETDKLNPQTLYAQCKADVESELLKLNDNNFQAIILRNSTIFGLAPRMRFDLAVNIMTLRAFKEKMIYLMGGGEQWRPFVHVQDVVRAFIFLMEHGRAGEIYNVGCENIQLKHLANRVSSALGGIPIYNVPDNVEKRDYNLSFDKLHNLGFNCNFDINYGINEIVTALQNGYTDDETCYTLQWYKKLIEWDKRIKELSINGKII